MKKYISAALTIIILFLVCVNKDLNAQSKGYGAKGGVTFSHFFDNSLVSYANFSVDFKSKAGFTAGGFVDMISKGNFVISSDLNFNSQVGSAKINTDNPYLRVLPKDGVDFHIDNLIYGVPAKYFFIRHKFSPYIYFEPQVNFYLGSEIKGINDTVTTSIVNIVSEELTKFGLGISVGGGTEFKLNKTLSILLDIQYSYNLYDVYYSDEFSVRNSSLQFTTGIKFY